MGRDIAYTPETLSAAGLLLQRCETGSYKTHIVVSKMKGTNRDP